MSLSLIEIRKLLLGERQFWNGTLRVTLLMREPGAREREVVLKNIYHMNEAEFRRFGSKRFSAPKRRPGPKSFTPTKWRPNWLRPFPGSIAFVDASRIPKNLKELKIDGRLPGR